MEVYNHERTRAISSAEWQEASGVNANARHTHNLRKADVVDGKSIADIMDVMPSHRVHTLEDVQSLIAYVAAHWSRIRAFITKGKVVRFFIMRCVWPHYLSPYGEEA